MGDSASLEGSGGHECEFRQLIKRTTGRQQQMLGIGKGMGEEITFHVSEGLGRSQLTFGAAHWDSQDNFSGRWGRILLLLFLRGLGRRRFFLLLFFGRLLLLLLGGLGLLGRLSFLGWLSFLGRLGRLLLLLFLWRFLLLRLLLLLVFLLFLLLFFSLLPSEFSILFRRLCCHGFARARGREQWVPAGASTQ